ncbi:MAG: helix-turn-helix transcriptional regulator [Tannerellaceae bacterium]|jgi:phage repressor protein C with HTH and peptisase S24 domain|nr:helix-turn-helix transcriptional regulator [Tannerellaceae bacterium]
MQEKKQKISPVKQRILQFVDYLGLTKRQFYSIVGVSRGTLESNTGITEDIVAKFIAAYPDVSITWLITGKGEMLKSDREEPPPIDDANTNFITIPIVDVAGAAGRGYINPDHPEQNGELKLPVGMLSRRTGNYYCGLVRGDSMYPTLLDRDYVIFRLLHPGEWGSVRDGEVYFIIDRFGEAYIKRVVNRLEKENRIICTSDNKEANIPDFNIMGDEISNIYYIECRLSNNMSNLNDYNRQLKDLREDMEMIKDKLKHL